MTFVCVGCKDEKDESGFYVNRVNGGRRMAKCKGCVKAQALARHRLIAAGKWHFTGSRGRPGNPGRPQEARAAAKGKPDTNRWRVSEKETSACPCAFCRQVRGGTPEDRAELITRVAKEMGVAVSENRWAGPKPQTLEEFKAHHAKVRAGRKRADSQVWT